MINFVTVVSNIPGSKQTLCNLFHSSPHKMLQIHGIPQNTGVQLTEFNKTSITFIKSAQNSLAVFW